MNDTTAPTRPDAQTLFSIASAQAGYFTAAQARESGYSSQLLAHHAGTGRFLRIARGLYRLRDYPSAPREEIVAAWLRAGTDAVVSHESALDLFGLSDVIPNAIHLTVPRARRKLARTAGVVVHTTTRPLPPRDTLWREGVRVTAPARTIVDAAETGIGPDQIGDAVRQAVDRGLTTPDRLRRAATGRGHRVERLINAAVATVTT